MMAVGNAGIYGCSFHAYITNTQAYSDSSVEHETNSRQNLPTYTRTLQYQHTKHRAPEH